jgi:hypothetical protein
VSFKEAYRAAQVKKIKPRPAGWSTLAEVAKELGMSRGHTSRVLNDMEANGRVTTMRWVKYDSTGKAAPSKLFKVKVSGSGPAGSTNSAPVPAAYGPGTLGPRRLLLGSSR